MAIKRIAFLMATLAGVLLLIMLMITINNQQDTLSPLTPPQTWPTTDYEQRKAHAITQLQEEHFQQAIAQFSILLKEKPADDELLAMRGFAFYRLGEHAMAIQDLEFAIHMAPAKENHRLLLEQIQSSR